jgi:hypothetical protein
MSKKKPPKELTQSGIWELVEMKDKFTGKENFEQVLEAVQEIEIALRGTKFSKKDGLFHQVEVIEAKIEDNKKKNEQFQVRLSELDKRVLKPEPLKDYIRGLIEEEIKIMIDAKMKKWWKIIAGLTTILPLVEFIILRYWN